MKIFIDLVENNDVMILAESDGGLVAMPTGEQKDK